MEISIRCRSSLVKIATILSSLSAEKSLPLSISIIKGVSNSSLDILSEANAGMHMSRIELLRTLEEPVLTSYVVTTVRNTAINILRRQKRDAQNITSFTESVEESIIEPDSIIDIIMDREAKRSLREAIDELEPNERLLLEGKYFLGYDDRQLSELLSCAPGSIRMKLTRVRRKVLCSMQEKGDV